MSVAPVNAQAIAPNLAEPSRRNVIRDVRRPDARHRKPRGSENWLASAKSTPALLSQKLVWIQACMVVIPNNFYFSVANRDRGNAQNLSAQYYSKDSTHY